MADVRPVARLAPGVATHLVINCFLNRRSYAAVIQSDATNEQSDTRSCVMVYGLIRLIMHGGLPDGVFMNSAGRFHPPRCLRCFGDKANSPSGSSNGRGSVNCSLWGPCKSTSGMKGRYKLPSSIESHTPLNHCQARPPYVPFTTEERFSTAFSPRLNDF